MARAGKSRLRSSRLRAAADDLGRGSKATCYRRSTRGAGERSADSPPQSRRAAARFYFAAPARAQAGQLYVQTPSPRLNPAIKSLVSVANRAHNAPTIRVSLLQDAIASRRNV